MIEHVRASKRTEGFTGAGRIAQRSCAAWAAGLSLLLSACGGGEVPDPPDEPVPPADSVVIDNVTREWEFRLYPAEPQRVGGGKRDGFLAVDEHHVFSEDVTSYLPPGRGPDAMGDVFSSATGQNYGVTADSPTPPTGSKVPVTSSVHYLQTLYYRKVLPEAHVDVKISAIRIEAGDGNTRFPPGCNAVNASSCPYAIRGTVTYALIAQYLGGAEPQALSFRTGWAELSGLLDNWEKASWENFVSAAGNSGTAWDDTHLRLISIPGGMNVATVELKEPITLRIPLDKVPVGGTFEVIAQIDAEASNPRRGESGVTVHFKDPVSGNAVEVTPVGVEPVAVPNPRPATTLAPQAEPTCTGATLPEAGRFELSVAQMQVAEGLAMRARIKRVGGSTGIASVQLSSRAGSATAVSDFPSFTRTLVFGDGQSADRFVDLVIPDDDQLEGDETFELQLSDPKGCAALGDITTTVVTIADDETANARYTLGGTVTGLQGSGLFLRSNGFDVRLDAAGPFTLPGGFATGTVYDLQVEVQPGNPLQVCRVTNGQGTVGSANVTDLAVVCDPPAPPPAGGALDPGFAGGLVSNPSHGRILSMALQPDGRIVVLTDFNKLLRYHADGTLDTSFGSNGVVNATLGGSALDLLRAVALQSDGSILVAGLARAAGGSTTAEDMGVRRYLPGGAVDSAFGTAGFVRVDIAGRSDDTTAIAVQPDGRIVLGGMALVNAVGASDFALARLQANGALDAGFGNGGTLTVNIGGAFDSAAAMALQADGAVVLVGRTATGGGATPDTGVARVSANGVVELALKLPLTAYWDEATGVAIQPDGKIVLTLEARPDPAGPVPACARPPEARRHAGRQLRHARRGSGRVLGRRRPCACAGAAGRWPHRHRRLRARPGAAAVGQGRHPHHPAPGQRRAGSELWQRRPVGDRLLRRRRQRQHPAAAARRKLVAGGLARSGSTNGLGLVRVLP